MKSLQEFLGLDLQLVLDKKMFLELFARIEGEEPSLNLDRKLTLRLNGKQVVTTVGRYVFNKFCLPQVIFEEHYNNEVMTKGTFFDFIDRISKANNFDKTITDEEYANFVDRLNWLSGQMVSINGGGITSDTASLDPKIKARVQSIADTITSDTSTVQMVKNDQEVTKLLTDSLVGTSLGEIMSDSGSKGKVSEQYKTMFGYRSKEIPNSLESLTFDDFNKKSGLDGSWGRSVLTREGGYAAKLVMGGLSHTRISGTDCKTNFGLTVKLEKLKPFMFRYVRLAASKVGPFELLDESTFKKYAGKNILLRSPMFCKDRKGYCEKCAGDMFKINNIRNNLSVYTSEMSSVLMLNSMGSMHRSKIEYNEYDFTKLV